MWDWRTGELVRFCGSNGYISLSSPHQVLDVLSTDRRELIKGNSQVTFLDEFLVAVIPTGWTITELVVFNTLIPQNHPGNLRRFGFPPESCGWRAKIFVDHDRDLGAPNRDEALIADPAQAVIAMEFDEAWEPRALLVVRTQVFSQPCSVHTGSSVLPWTEWGRYAVALWVPVEHVRKIFTFVHGAQVMVVRTFFSGGWDRPEHPCYHVHTFNFGRGCPLPLRRGANGTGWMALFTDGVDFRFESGTAMGVRDELGSLGDGSLFSLVSRLSQPRGSVVVG